MASINSPIIVRTILENDGVYPGDPPCCAIYRYENMWGGTAFKLCYNVAEERAFLFHGHYNNFLCLFRDRKLTDDGQNFLKQQDD